MKAGIIKCWLLSFIFLSTSSTVCFAQDPLLVTLGSNTCADPTQPIFSIMNDLRAPFPSVLADCNLSTQLPDYNDVFIAYNPLDNKIYVNDIRTGSSKVWVLDVGLPTNITCPPFIPITPTYAYAYVPSHFEFDNNGNIWSLRNYNPFTGRCRLDRIDVTNGNVLASKILQFPLGHLPTELGDGDVSILPNGRMFVVLGIDPSQLYEVTNYNGGVGNATATYLQTIPNNCYGIAYLNGSLEITGTDLFSSCYYYMYDISSNTLSPQQAYQDGQSPIDNTSISPTVGVAKQLINATVINNNTADLTYDVYVKNMGNVVLTNVNATDDLGKAFGAANISNVSTSLIPIGDYELLSLNNAYNGTSNTSLLEVGGQNLPNQTGSDSTYYFEVEIKCRVTNLHPLVVYNNSAVAMANIGNGWSNVSAYDSANDGPPSAIDPNNDGNPGELGENIPTPYMFQVPPCTDSYIYMPNAFTPNGDGINDVLTVFANNVTLNKFQIFNRWGQLVFETTDINQGWDGVYKNSITEDNYVYYIYYYDCYDNNQPKMMKGNVLLIK